MKTAVRLAAWVIAVSLILGACATGGSGSEFQTYQDPDNRTLFELPSDWNHYILDQLTQLESVPFIPDLGGYQPITYVAFDGAAGVANLQNMTIDVTESPYPVGARIIRSITQTEKEELSRSTLTSSVYEFASAQGLQNIQVSDFSFGNAYDGVRKLVGVTSEDGVEEGAIYMVVVTNPEVTEMYSMAVGCSLACFQERSDEIFKAVDSWLVNTRR